MESSAGYRERGIASWYGTKFHGRRTANGERYDMLAMTAAHKTLPIPSYVRVTHVQNGRSVIVKINDRGPFHDGRIIDLSYAAARKLGIDVTGTAWVDVVDVTPDHNDNADQSHIRVATGKTNQSSTKQSIFLQIGAFQQLQTANSLQSKVASLVGVPININQGVDKLHRVILGPLANERQVPELRRKLEDAGLNSGYILRRP
jgi:rare lipoprotein A